MKFLPIDTEDEKLIEAARETLEKRYRSRRHTVAAAVLCESGKVYTGINVEAVAYGPCAEPIAIGRAFTDGDWEIKAIVAVGKEGVLSPCGNCRQLIFDYAPDAVVIFDDNGKIVKTEARNLLPGYYVSNF
ncbi:MAG: cytidine deaminase [Candidatus Hydrogenedentota bacterium]|nr:MAG: cytidine deaminase [Candidatus Hydrogenedentota bacterium]